MLRTSEALKLGIHPRTLYELRDANRIVQLGRGLYRLADAAETEHHDLVTVVARVPDGVICLISALSFHGITTEVPHEVYLAIRHGKERPRLDYPPLRVFRFSDETLSAGVEKHKLEGVVVRLFNPAKTVADCFKFRHKIGVDVAVEALKLSLARGKARPAQILHYARLCRVERVIRPYLEALV
jgi:predicted transcriptional regulator of viral defense system